MCVGGGGGHSVAIIRSESRQVRFSDKRKCLGGFQEILILIDVGVPTDSVEEVKSINQECYGGRRVRGNGRYELDNQNTSGIYGV